MGLAQSTMAAVLWSLLAALCLVRADVRDDVACGSGRLRVITDTNGAFTSPNYPDEYPNNANCQWRLTAASNSGRVRMEFEDFATEATYDKCDIHAGDSTSATRIGSLRGSQRAQSFESTGRNMYLAFTTDGSVTERGFKGKFTTYVA